MISPWSCIPLRNNLLMRNCRNPIWHWGIEHTLVFTCNEYWIGSFSQEDNSKIMTASFSLHLCGSLFGFPEVTKDISNVGIKVSAQIGQNEFVRKLPNDYFPVKYTRRININFIKPQFLAGRGGCLIAHKPTYWPTCKWFVNVSSANTVTLQRY